jgi:4a-hydroxytetrahydrobiopterin dehydratase
MDKDRAENIYAPQATAARLAAELADWAYRDGFLCRTYAATGWKATLLIVNAIGYLCEAAWHHPDLEVSYNRVTVKLKSHDVDAITDRDFDLARKIEEVVGWAPTRQTGALTGPPKSQRILAEPA